MIVDPKLVATQKLPSLGAEEGHAKAALDGRPFRDQSRFLSLEVTRAFASAVRSISKAPRSAVSEPAAVGVEFDAAISDLEIVRGVD